MQNNLLSEKCINLWRMRATVILILLSFIDGGLFVFFPDWSIFLGIIAVIAYFLMIIFYFPTLYKKCGFIESGRRHNGLRFDDGTYHDEILMYKDLT